MQQFSQQKSAGNRFQEKKISTQRVPRSKSVSREKKSMYMFPEETINMQEVPRT